MVNPYQPPGYIESEEIVQAELVEEPWPAWAVVLLIFSIIAVVALTVIPFLGSFAGRW